MKLWLVLLCVTTLLKWRIWIISGTRWSISVSKWMRRAGLKCIRIRLSTFPIKLTWLILSTWIFATNLPWITLLPLSFLISLARPLFLFNTSIIRNIFWRCMLWTIIFWKSIKSLLLFMKLVIRMISTGTIWRWVTRREEKMSSIPRLFCSCFLWCLLEHCWAWSIWGQGSLICLLLLLWLLWWMLSTSSWVIPLIFCQRWKDILLKLIVWGHYW